MIGWKETPDFATFEDRDALRAALATTYPDEKPKTLSNWEAQLCPFGRVMVGGDPW